jgi:general secretion pathway protein I
MKKNGFTLLEVLVALTIMAVMLATLLRAFGSGMRSLDTAQNYAVAAMQARSVLDQVGPVIPLQPGEYDGELDNGSKWRVVVTARDAAASGFDRAAAPVDYIVDVAITWQDGRALDLRTLRLGTAQ